MTCLKVNIGLCQIRPSVSVLRPRVVYFLLKEM